MNCLLKEVSAMHFTTDPGRDQIRKFHGRNRFKLRRFKVALTEFERSIINEAEPLKFQYIL
jgi:hypothetical protein